jgi:hypothetical protein
VIDSQELKQILGILDTNLLKNSLLAAIRISFSEGLRVLSSLASITLAVLLHNHKRLLLKLLIFTKS